MDLAALRVFKTVVEEGGIVAAAKKLHRVQSNVTTRVKQLEASLGTNLFIRKKKRLHLSPAGELFLKYAEQLLDLSEQARAAVASDEPRGVLRLGTLESTAASRLPPLLSRFHDKYPAVRIELTTGTADALVDAVLERRVEAAFVADCQVRDQLEVVPAFSEELVLIAPRSHPRIRRAQDVRADTIISFPSGCAYRRHLQAWLATGGVVPDKALDLSSYHAIVACVAAGTGIAFAPRSVLQTVSAAEAVAVYPLKDKPLIQTSLVWRKGESSRALQALRSELSTPNGRRRG
ncbi:MAG TPA: LysR family transcriptional regulator [Burkholderiales bacterium]|nr:LysR family transcriptional regulator [Burkholderiales bacterium]